METYQVVCIDDDEQFLGSLETSLPGRVTPLCQDFECVFEFVSTAEELMAVLESPPRSGASPAMVISDQVMPGITGVELLEQVKARYPDLVCILLTGHAGLDSARYAINRRLLDQYVAKPIPDLQEFAMLVVNLLQRHHLHLEERNRTEQLAATIRQLQTSNERIRSMHAAAEQVALLAKGLKSLDFDEVVELAGQEVPRIFNAQWGVVCFPDGRDDGPAGVVACRQACPCSAEVLLGRQDARGPCPEATVLTADAPAACKRLGAQSPTVVIPLSVTGLCHSTAGRAVERQGYLCLCRIGPQGEDWAELVQYKGALVHDILTANLSNARLYQQARRDSQTDPLTGACTRRVLDERLEAEQERSMRYGGPFCVAIMDVDNFKSINDQSGHSEGDQVLRDVARVARDEIRAPDVLVRYGGDEFVLLMPETNLAEAGVVVERLRLHVAERFAASGSPVTISCGLAAWSGRPGDSGTDVLRRADAALYAAKRAGRNRLEVAAEAYAA